ncbi:MAG: hypothetical protein GF317_22450 [Candidatus Lokiarchaeota archaeon]|nr:hypothetical protein [Candidatus Lokiarchaeota archaeon]MBD3202222.1 hypothetical protein [Candidatus Lokiarchaeota archaeon]
MTSPTSTHDGPYSTNTLVSKKFIILYLTIIWLSLYPLLLESLLYLYLLEISVLLFFVFLPIQIFIGYFILVFSSLFIAKIFLIIIGLIHKPKEGIFLRKKSNKDYYYWSLRAVIKKWAIWLINLIPSSVLNNILLTIFGVRTSFSNSLNDGIVDTEFIEFGKNINIAKGAFVKSCMIYKEFLIIKKITIENSVEIGPHSYIAPGTHIQTNTIVNIHSVTKLSQTLLPNSLYYGYPVKKTCENLGSKNSNYSREIEKQLLNNAELDELFKLTKPIKNHNQSNSKFIVKIPLYLLIFLFIYVFSYVLPLTSLGILLNVIYIPIINSSFPLIYAGIFNIPLFLISLIPLILLLLHILNICCVTVLTKLLYYIITKINSPKEGIFHWSQKSRDYRYYFIRSFLLRYVKWKIQRGPYPWLIKIIFNFLGNSSFGKGVIVEDMYLSKEFIEVGDNVYLGKILLTNQLWDKALTVKGVKIENNAVISDGSCIAPGTHIAENVMILPFSVTSKYEKLNKNEIYYGAPIKKVEDQKELDKLFNINNV